MTIEYYGHTSPFSNAAPLVATLPSDGTITALVKNVFTLGQCHSLALALHRLTNWPIHGLYINQRDLAVSPSHCVTISPKGWLDITGFNNRLWMQGITEHMVTEKPISVELLSKPPLGYLPPQVDAALPFAHTLLRKYFPFKFNN